MKNAILELARAINNLAEAIRYRNGSGGGNRCSCCGTRYVVVGGGGGGG